MEKRFVYLGLFLLTFVASQLPAQSSRLEPSAWKIPTHCEDNKECLIELPGAYCADGTKSFVTLTKRPQAKNLLIYLTGGGACWSEETCNAGYARVLTRKEDPTDWNHGGGIHDAGDSLNPFRKDFHVLTIPYCTGDAFTGNRVIDYGKRGAQKRVHHVGYRNALLAFDAAKALYPNPERVALVGCSAGGIGAAYHLRNVAQRFPDSKKYVVSDAGTPFRPPFVNEAKYQQIIQNWGANKTLPVFDGGQAATNFAEVWKYNTQVFPEVRFGFISSYGDKVMSFFAWTLGASGPFAAVKKMIIDAADHALGDVSQAKVFFTEGTLHCHTPKTLSHSTSTNSNLGQWLTAMMNDESAWDNERPDQSRNFIFEEPATIPSLEEVQKELP